MKSNKLTNVLLYVSLAIFLFGSGYKVAEWNLKKNSRQQYAYTVFNANNPDFFKNKDAKNLDFNLFWDTWEKVEQRYIDESKIDQQKMFYGAIKGMVASIGDPYTFFLTPDENQQSKDDLGGKFEGIGAQLGLRDNRVVVIAPLKNSPAEAAGVRAGDYILKVDGEATDGWTLSQTVSKIRGEKGTSVKLTLGNASGEKEVTITRDQIKVESVELTFETSNGKRVAHLKLNQFGETTNTEWDQAVSTIEKEWKAGQIAGMVLDVRGNPGGYLESSVYLGSEFIEQGKTIVTQETTDGNDRTYKVTRQGKLIGIPLNVLIDGGSASASEILAGALRDHKKATLIGQKSFGKGSVQEALDLKDGAGLHVTIAKWILPNGDWIMGKGLEPEIAIENEVPEGNTITKETDKQLNEALRLISE